MRQRSSSKESNNLNNQLHNQSKDMKN